MLDDLLKYFHTPNWRKQGNWRRTVWDTAARLGLTGIHGLPVNRRWIEFHRRTMPFAGLDPVLAGMKIVQISDLHYSPMVWKGYLDQFMDWVNDLEPDMVFVTGDLVTGGYRWALRVAQILERLKAPQGVICTFGNHDYSFYGKQSKAEGLRRADYLEKALEHRGLIVLRNEVLRVTRTGATKPLTIVGLDDEWSGAIDAPAAFAQVSPDETIVCINHNPINARELLRYPWQWMVAGHTHGRQVGTTKFGRHVARNQTRPFVHGHYSIDGRHLYVNRGLSYGQRIKDWCRPEITVFKLTRVEN